MGTKTHRIREVASTQQICLDNLQDLQLLVKVQDLLELMLQEIPPHVIMLIQN